jgi:hypothetical protein
LDRCTFSIPTELTSRCPRKVGQLRELSDVGIRHGLRGDLAVERRALDYYADDLGIGLKQESIAALLKQIDISEPPQKYFDDPYLARALATQ